MKQFVTVALLLIGTTLVAQTKADAIVGVWLTGGKEPAKIQVYKASDKYFGKIVWLKNPDKDGKPKVDSKNPDKSKQGQKIIGLVILQNFKFDEEDEWNDGKIYDPESGQNLQLQFIAEWQQYAEGKRLCWHLPPWKNRNLDTNCVVGGGVAEATAGSRIVTFLLPIYQSFYKQISFLLLMKAF